MRAEENKAAACILTQGAGASRGMGRFAAIELARLGAEILVVGHNQVRGR
jgi:D-arabinose 5-phosphate isomerase GutQ